MKYKTGFTLIEIILVLAMLGVISVIFLPSYSHFYLQNNLNIATNDIVATLNRAQVLTKGAKYDSAWGVYFSDHTEIILFQGASFLNRDPLSDEVIPLSGISDIVGESEIVFEKITGELIAEKNLTIYGNNQESTNVFINKAGTIIY